MTITVRNYLTSDHKQVWAVHLLAVTAAGFSSAIAELDFDHDIEAAYIKSGGVFVVATIDDKIVGMGGLKRSGPILGEITRMRVHPDFQKKGIGKKILSYLENMARESKFKKIHLDTINPIAKTFYLKHGYKLSNQKIEGLHDCIFFEKNI